MTETGMPAGHVFFSGEDRLEGILEWPAGSQRPDDEPGDAGRGVAGTRAGGTPGAPAGSTRLAGGVVVAHPHPLYGGTMAQPVVYRVAQACREQGFVSLRFNFRGVGRSRGHYSGIEEYRDVEAAAAFLRGRLAEAEGVAEAGGRALPLAVAGYSFGSVMAALAAASGAVPIQALALVALVPRWEEWQVGMLDGLARFRNPILAICGEADDLAPPSDVERALTDLRVDYRLVVVPATGHLFEHKQREVGEAVAGFFAKVLVGRRGERAGPPLPG